MDHKDYRLSAVMFTDIVGFSKMMETDESATLELLSYHNKMIGDFTQKHNGSIIKTIGDAFLVDFKNTVDALKCAVNIQNELAAYNINRKRDPLLLRIGIHLGDIYFFENDALGEGINIASRLQSIAKPGRICISEDVYRLVSNKLDVRMDKLGRVALKNISRHIEAYEVIPEDVIKAESQINKENAEEEENQRIREAYAEYGVELPGGKKKDSSAEEAGASGFESSSQFDKSHNSQNGETEDIDFSELKNLVLDEIKRAGRRLPIGKIRSMFPSSHHSVDRVLNNLADKGFLTRLNKEKGGESYGAVDGDDLIEKEDPWVRMVQEYRARVFRTEEKITKSFVGHIISYIGVNGFLLFLNIITGFGHPWFLYPAMGWGIGLASHFMQMRLKKQEKQDLESIQHLNKESFTRLKSLHKLRNGFLSQLVSSLTTSTMLIVINLITSSAFPWAVFPVGAMAIGIFARLPWYASKKERLEKELKVALEKGGVPTHSASNISDSEHQKLVQQAHIIKSTILEHLKSFDDSSAPLGVDIEEVLGTYVLKIEDLAKKNDELDAIVGTIPMGDLEKDLARLDAQIAKEESVQMVNEYKKSISEIENQKSSYAKLKAEQSMLHLRLKNSVNSLKRMQLDLARMKSLSASGEEYALDDLKKKSDELSLYLDDFKKSFDEL